MAVMGPSGCGKSLGFVQQILEIHSVGEALGGCSPTPETLNLDLKAAQHLQGAGEMRVANVRHACDITRDAAEIHGLP